MKIPYIDCHSHRSSKNQETIVLKSHGIGIHPWNVESQKEFQLNSKVPFIGEIGLDRFSSNFEKQKEVFIQQLYFAQNNHKTVVIHSVKAHNEVISAIKDLHFNELILIHGFVGTIDELKSYLKFNSLISYGHALFNSPKTQESLKETPLDRLLLETDDQDEYKISDIYNKASDILGMNLEKLKAIIFENYNKRLGDFK